MNPHGRPKTPLDQLYEPEPNSGCWIWTGSRDDEGYGNVHLGIYAKPRYQRAHRYFYEQEHGPTDLPVLHRCDNPPCVNPAHLFAGTPLDNVRDCIAKGRRARLAPPRHVGSEHPHAKVTEEIVREIRRLAGALSQEAIAGRFGLHQAHVSRIIRRTSWSHVA